MSAPGPVREPCPTCNDTGTTAARYVLLDACPNCVLLAEQEWRLELARRRTLLMRKAA